MECFLLFLLPQYNLLAQRATIIGTKGNQDPPYLLRGNVFDIETGEKIYGANIKVIDQELGTSSDINGRYELSLYPGAYTIQTVSYTHLTLPTTSRV